MVKPELDALSCGTLGFVMDNSAVISASVAIDFSAGQGVVTAETSLGGKTLKAVYIYRQIYIYLYPYMDTGLIYFRKGGSERLQGS